MALRLASVPVAAHPPRALVSGSSACAAPQSESVARGVAGATVATTVAAADAAPLRAGNGTPTAWRDRLLVETHEARIRGLEQSLATQNQRHSEEVAALDNASRSAQASAQRLRATLAERDEEVLALRKEIAERFQLATEAKKEALQLRQALAAKEAEAERLQQQVRFHMDHAKQCQSVAESSRIEKDNAVAPLLAQVQDLSHELKVTKRQLALVQKEMETIESRQHDSRVESLDQMHRQRIQELEQFQHIELERRDEQLRQLREELQATTASAAEREKRLLTRCRLLQTWCFRAWWCYPDSSLSQSADAHKATDSRSKRSASPFATSSHADDNAIPSSGMNVAGFDTAAVPRPRQMPPADWLEVLRFQATLFQWLAAEMTRARTLAQTNRVCELEARLARAAVEVRSRGRELHSLLQARRDAERAGWQHERQLLEARLGEREGSLDDEEIRAARSKATADVAAMEARLGDLQLLDPIEELLQQLATEVDPDKLGPRADRDGAVPVPSGARAPPDAVATAGSATSAPRGGVPHLTRGGVDIVDAADVAGAGAGSSGAVSSLRSIQR